MNGLKVSEFLFFLQKKFSKKVNKIISNSKFSIEFHKKSGFYMNNSVVIPNGMDTYKFKRDFIKREEFREKYNLKNSDIAIAIVSRIDFVKGYLIFSKMAKNILEKYDNIYFFSVGGGDDNIKKDCKDILGTHENFFWLGNQNNIENLYSGFDIVVSSSFSEGFSNSIAEAMSCECACVVTDVGDSSMIVDNLGIVVEPNSVESLYNGVENMIKLNYKELGIKSRERIVNNFSVVEMVKNTEKEILKCVE